MKAENYTATDPVNWAEAIAMGGFYFERARYLGLPKPPAAFVFEDDFERNDEVLKIIGRYHAQFSEAEADAAQQQQANF